MQVEVDLECFPFERGDLEKDSDLYFTMFVCFWKGLGSKIATKMRKITTRRLQDGFEMALYDLKMASRWSQNGSKMAQDVSRWLQNGSRWPQDGPEMAFLEVQNTS